MIVDAFTYLNEIECLDIRLHEMYDLVDAFILCESDRTFTGNSKPFYFSDEQYSLIDKKFKDKIHILKCTGINDSNEWNNEFKQRDELGKYIVDFFGQNKGYVLLSDVDEIPDAKKVKEQIDNNVTSVCFSQQLYYYYLNCRQNQLFNGSVLIKQDCFPGGQSTRNLVNHANRVIGGWHFSYLGGASRIKYKLESICFSSSIERKPSFTDIKEIEYKISNQLDIVDRNGDQFEKTIVEIDSTYPSCIHEMIQKYPYIIKK